MPNPPRPGRHWPRPETEYEWQDGWARPEPPRRAAPPPPQRPPRTSFIFSAHWSYAKAGAARGKRDSLFSFSIS